MRDKLRLPKEKARVEFFSVKSALMKKVSLEKNIKMKEMQYFRQLVRKEKMQEGIVGKYFPLSNSV